MKQNEMDWNGLKWNKSEQTHTDRFTSERSGTERNGRKRLRKRFSISLHAQTERNGMGNGMEWNGMKQNETERNRMKQNEMDEQTHTDRSALNGAERSGTGAVRARAFVLFSKSPSPRLGLGLEPDPALQK